MKRLLVRYRGWGEDWPLGELADDGTDLLFEYSEEAQRQGLELSPLHLPLRPEAYGDFPSHLFRLPGLIADSLPDGWGLLLMDRYFRRLGLEPAAVSPLDRLALLGERALGALTFEPMTPMEFPRNQTTLLELAQEVTEVIEGKDGEALKRLLILGGSPHGARPKALVGYCAARGTIRSLPDADHLPFLIKFPAGGEHKEVCAIEHAYCEMARACGVDTPETRHFDLDRSHAAFGIERFDVEAGSRVPVHSLAGALHADFRVPAVDYISLMRATRALTRDEREVSKAYQRAAFNVLFNNRDDHPRNFAFRLARDRRWSLAPAYDLTFSSGPGGEHHMDVCGEARRITRDHMLDLADRGGLRARDATEVLNRLLDQLDLFERQLQRTTIRRNTVRTIMARVQANAAALRGKA